MSLYVPPPFPLPWGRLADGSLGYRRAEVERHCRVVQSTVNEAWRAATMQMIEQCVPMEKLSQAYLMLGSTMVGLQPAEPIEVAPPDTADPERQK